MFSDSRPLNIMKNKQVPVFLKYLGTRVQPSWCCCHVSVLSVLQGHFRRDPRNDDSSCFHQCSLLKLSESFQFDREHIMLDPAIGGNGDQRVGCSEVVHLPFFIKPTNE